MPLGKGATRFLLLCWLPKKSLWHLLEASTSGEILITPAFFFCAGCRAAAAKSCVHKAVLGSGCDILDTDLKMTHRWQTEMVTHRITLKASIRQGPASYVVSASAQGRRSSPTFFFSFVPSARR